MYTKQLILTTVMLLATGCAANPQNSASDNTKEVEQATAKFYTSLNALFTGDAAPMQEVWSHSDDVTYMGPAGGFQVGWEDIRKTWEAQAALKLGGKIEPAETRTTVGTDLAVVHCYERGENKDTEGQPVQVSIRTTSVFRKESGTWKMIGHHTDLLPFLEKQASKSAE